MGRATSKTDLIGAAQTNYKKLNELIESMTEKELSTAFDFSADVKKKEAHWRRERTQDILIHLYEWHQLKLVSSKIRKGEE